MRVRALLPPAGLLAAIVLTVAACSTTTAGNGSQLTPSGASSHDFPSVPIPEPSDSTVSGSPASTPPRTATATPPAKPTRAQLAARLAALTPGQRLVLVAITGGFEAVSYDQNAHLSFWKSTGTDWAHVGASTYPYSPTIGGPADAQAIGTVLARMRDATFIVTGNFTGDGSGNAVAYTTGASGWGAIKAEPNGRIGPSGHPVGSDQIGLSFGFAFVGGLLQTKDCPLNQPVAACGANPVVKLWVWNGTDFSRA
jgi:hypothetical protein